MSQPSSRGTVAFENLDPLFARGIADRDKRLAVRQPLAEPVAHSVALTPLADRAFPQSEAERLPRTSSATL